jgi:prolyl-tRNA synthetase
MRLSQSFGRTLREAPADAELTSHKLLIRANFVRPVGAGIYTFMPLGYRVIRRIWEIMAEEMDAIGGQEMWMPNLHPAALWQATGRWDTVDVLMKVKAGGGREYALSATHEEVVTDLACARLKATATCRAWSTTSAKSSATRRGRVAVCCACANSS